jgi:hypothetical protein
LFLFFCVDSYVAPNKKKGDLDKENKLAPYKSAMPYIAAQAHGIHAAVAGHRIKLIDESALSS